MRQTNPRRAQTQGREPVGWAPPTVLDDRDAMFDVVGDAHPTLGACSGIGPTHRVARMHGDDAASQVGAEVLVEGV